MRSRWVLRGWVGSLLSSSLLCGCGAESGAERLTARADALETNPPVVIRQIFAHSATSSLKCDFVELVNKSGASVSLSGWSLQRASSNLQDPGTHVLPLPAVTLSAGQIFVIQERCEPGAVLPIPPDLVDPTPPPSMLPPSSGGGISFGLARTTTAVTFPTGGVAAGSPNPAFADLMGCKVSGAGYSPTGHEGASTPTPLCPTGGTLALRRKANGTQDTNDNSNDFTTGEPVPCDRRQACVSGTLSPNPAGCDNTFAVAVDVENDDVVAAGGVGEPEYKYQRYNASDLLWLSEQTVDRHRRPPNMRSATSLGGPHGNRSLLFEGYSVPASGNDRLELTLSQSGGSRDTVLEFGEWRYLRFFMRVHPEFGLDANHVRDFNHEVMASQVWQRGSASVGPAFAINLAHIQGGVCPSSASQPCSSIAVRFSYRNEYANDELSGLGTGDNNVLFHNEVIPVDQWVGFLVAMKPVYVPHHASDPTSRGAILIWRLSPSAPDAGLSGTPGVAPFAVENAVNYSTANNNQSYQFFWGYRPKPALGLKGTFDIRVGMYRQPSIYSAYWMDSIKLTNLETLMPGLDEYPVTGSNVCPSVN